MDRARALEAVMKAANVLLAVATAVSNTGETRERYMGAARTFLYIPEPGQAKSILTYRPDLIDLVWAPGTDYDLELREALEYLATEET